MNDAYANMMEGDKVTMQDLWTDQQEAKLRLELITKYDWNLVRFPLPVRFEPYEERKLLALRKMRITEIVDRMLNIARIRFHKKTTNQNSQ